MDILHPGVYVQEMNTGVGAIEGAPTSTLGIYGVAERGVKNTPVFITNFDEFVENFGGYLSPSVSQLAYAVKGFFDNGGSKAYVVRHVEDDAVKASNDLMNDTPEACFNAYAKSEGAWGNRLVVDVARTETFVGKLQNNATGTTELFITAPDYLKAGDVIKIGSEYFEVVDASGTYVKVDSAVTASADEAVYVMGFDLTVYENGEVVEAYTELRLSAEASNGYALATENSKYISLEPVAGKTGINKVPADATSIALAGGADGSEISGFTPDYSVFDGVKIQLLATPGLEDEATINSMIAYAEGRKDLFVIAAVPAGKTPAEAVTFRAETGNFNSSYAALYYPHVKIVNPRGAGTLTVSPVGHVAGIYARIDSNRNVAKAPAGAQATVLGIVGFERVLKDSEQDLLNPKGINALRSVPGVGMVVWGARTLSSDPQWRYINIRRAFIYVETSLLEGTAWAAFEPNDASLWGRLKAAVDSFLSTAYNSGLFPAAPKEQVYFVVCDSSVNTPDVVDAGRVVVKVGLAFAKPAEFIIIKIGQKNLNSAA